MNYPISELIKKLDQPQTADELVQIVDALAQYGSPIISDLLQSVNSFPLRKGKRASIMQVLQKIGYPANKSAMAFVVGEASDINSPGWDIALSMLKQVGKPIIPEVHKAFQFYLKDYNEYGPYFQGLCTLLEQMGSPAIDSLLPDLIQLLEIGTDENFVDEYALWPIRKIGSPKANAVIPLLQNKILDQSRERARQASIEALEDFDPMAVRPLIPVLQGCLSDKSEVIRTSARKVLEVLGKTASN